MQDDLEFKYAIALNAANREYIDTEGNLDRAVIAALESDRIDDLPMIEQVEVLAWSLYTEYCINEDIQNPHYNSRPCNWEGVQKNTWMNIARRAILMMQFAR